MTNEVKIDRDTASKINPLISSLWTEDTLDAARLAIYELGYILTTTELAIENLFHIFGVIASALEWERDNIHSVAQARKERTHGN